MMMDKIELDKLHDIVNECWRANQRVLKQYFSDPIDCCSVGVEVGIEFLAAFLSTIKQEHRRECVEYVYGELKKRLLEPH